MKLVLFSAASPASDVSVCWHERVCKFFLGCRLKDDDAIVDPDTGAAATVLYMKRPVVCLAVGDVGAKIQDIYLNELNKAPNFAFDGCATHQLPNLIRTATTQSKTSCLIRSRRLDLNKPRRLLSEGGKQKCVGESPRCSQGLY